MNLNGQLLIATPILKDPNFAKTVIAVINHSHDGATGLVLNTPVETKDRPDIRLAWVNLFGEQMEHKMDRLYIGGPVPCSLIMAHDYSKYPDNEIVPGAYVTNDQKALAEIVDRDDVSFRCFAGYASWTPGQLESELAKGIWYVHENSRSSVFYDTEPTKFWECQLKDWSRNFLCNALNLNPNAISNDPRFN